MFIILLYEIDSNEEISSNYIEKFIITNLKLKGIRFADKSRILYSYINSLAIYQIIVFENKAPSFLYFKSRYKSEIFIDKDYAVVYKNFKFFYYQKLEENSSVEEITQFLEKRLNLKESVVNSSGKSANSKIIYNFIKPIKSNLFRYFILYFLFLLSLFYFYDLEIKKEKTNLIELRKTTKNLKEELIFYSVSKTVKSLINLADKSKTKIIFISLKDSKISLKLQAKDKSDIYNFLKDLNKNSVVNVFYDKEKGRFIGDATFKIYRR